MAYTNITTVKSYLGDVQGSIDDTLITGFIAAAQLYIDGYCHQTFEAAADTTRTFDPCADVDGRTLYFDAPLIAITSVTNGDGVVVAPSAYVTEPRNMTPWYGLTLKSNSSVNWTYGGALENAIAIGGKWAYSLTADANIQQAAQRLAAYFYRQRDNGFDLDRIIQTQSGVVMPLDLPRDIAKLLEPYKRIVI
jgi:hypothetical protein